VCLIALVCMLVCHAALSRRAISIFAAANTGQSAAAFRPHFESCVGSRHTLRFPCGCALKISLRPSARGGASRLKNERMRRAAPRRVRIFRSFIEEGR
jgi:hypothetical protein